MIKLGINLWGKAKEPDGLSLDLQFAADKTLTARKGPTPVFSRGSSGTFVNANGLIVGKTTVLTLSNLTPSSQAIGSQVSVIVFSGYVAGWVVGQPISLIVDTDGQDDPDATELWLLGNIVSIVAGILTFEVTSRTAQAGSALSWTLGYRGPRFDHDPVTLACKGLLIEESRTNFVLNSDLYSSATPTNITATTITGTSVTGLSQIRELSLTSSGLFTGVQANLTGTGTGIKTLSVFIKKPPANAAPYFTIGFASSAVQYAGIQVTMTGSTPVVSVTSTAIGGFSVVSSSIETFPNGWYRISVVVNGVPASCFATLYPSNAAWDGISDIRQTLVASGTNLIYICGAQVESGAFPTSYIPTTTASAARSADLCTITSSAFNSFYNQSEGTFLSKTQLFSIGNDYNASYWNVFNGAISIYMRISVFGQTPTVENSFLQNDASTLNSTVSSQSSRISRAAGAYQLNNARLVKNGTLGILDNAFTPYSNLISLTIMSQASGTMESLRYYRKRLPDAKLQTLTV
jgi:hypothetical protein